MRRNTNADMLTWSVSVFVLCKVATMLFSLSHPFLINAALQLQLSVS